MDSPVLNFQNKLAQIIGIKPKIKVLPNISDCNCMTIEIKKRWFTHRPIAHRGLHNEDSPENSLKAFENAINKDIPIELDIHQIRDGEIVVCHDYNLKRLTGVDGKLASFNYDKLSKFKILKSDQKIPTLKEVLELVDGKVPMLIELKCKKFSTSYCQAVYDLLKNYKGLFAIQAFNPLALSWFRKNHPELTLGLLSGDMSEIDISPSQKFMLENLLLFHYVKPDFVAYEFDQILGRKIQLMRKMFKVPFLAWTVTDSASQEKCKKVCENIIFENFSPQ